MLLGGSALTLGIAAQATATGHAGAQRLRDVRDLSVAVLDSPADEELEQPAQAQVAARIKTGVAVPMVDLKIIDASGNEVPQDGEALGEIVVRAPG